MTTEQIIPLTVVNHLRSDINNASPDDDGFVIVDDAGDECLDTEPGAHRLDDNNLSDRVAALFSHTHFGHGGTLTSSATGVAGSFISLARKDENIADRSRVAASAGMHFVLIGFTVSWVFGFVCILYQSLA